MKNYNELATLVWNTKNVDEKRRLINMMIDTFKYKSKAEKFRREAAYANATRLDFLASNLMLNDTDKVIK